LGQQLSGPTEVAGGRKLVALSDAAPCITRLPEAEHDADEQRSKLAPAPHGNAPGATDVCGFISHHHNKKPRMMPGPEVA
jgi:hypothetical protein